MQKLDCQVFKSSLGFTLIEMLTTMAVAAVVLSIAIPNLAAYIRNNRLTSTSTDLIRSIQHARTEATKRQRTVVFCMSANPQAANPACSTSLLNGWIVFQDTNNNWDHEAGEEVVEARLYDPSAINLYADQSYIVSFAATGFSNPAGAKTSSTSIVMCDDRGNSTVGSQSVARGIVITNTGRASLTRDPTSIGTMLGSGKINHSCP